jgi:signal peptidase II
MVAVLTGLCLAAKIAADRQLSDKTVNLGPLDLRLGFNSGVAFGLGDQLPKAVIVTVTAAITLGVFTVAWRSAHALSSGGIVGFAAVAAGALSNVFDRAGDGRVTDYFHSGWYPTFNLPDVLITVGAGLIVLGMLREDRNVDISGRNSPA